MPELRWNPYGTVDWDGCERHRAQFHTHTSHPPTESHSGSDPPEAVIDAYSDAGYSALVLTEHEYNIEGTTWPWTDWDRDPHRLDMVAIEGAELGGGEGRVSHDTLSLYNDLADTAGMSIHDALEAIGARDGLAIFAHPGRYHEPDACEWYVEYFEAHPHLLGVEIVNAADRYPTDRDLWDRLQTRLGNERGVWGFANDDYHGPEEDYAFDRARNVLVLDALTAEAVRAALEGGRFYYQYALPEDAPPEIVAVDADADRGELTVRARRAERIEWIADGEVVHRGATLPYRDAAGLGGYARARLVTAAGSETGTQPFLFEGR